jgi:hypothetical protein
MEAFSDGVIAILITVMVLELRPPEGTDWPALRQRVFHDGLSYVLSFGFLGLYWSQMLLPLRVCDRVRLILTGDGPVHVSVKSGKFHHGKMVALNVYTFVQLNSHRQYRTAFTHSEQRWLVAVRMVSEGVDVPRLAVGVYATSTSTRRWT